MTGRSFATYRTSCAAVFAVLATLALSGCGDNGGPRLDDATRSQLLEINVAADRIEHLEKSSREKIAAVEKRIAGMLTQRANISELAAAYGQLGMRLHAYLLDDAAEPCYRNAMYLAPDEPRWPYLLGHVCRKSAEPQRAVKWFQKALEKISSDEETQRLAALYWIGDVHLALGNFRLARESFEAIVRQRENSAAGHYGVGRALLREGQPRKAAAAFEKAARAMPNSPSIHYQLMLAYRQAKDDERARIHQQRFQSRGRDLEIDDPWLEKMELVADTARVYRMRGNAAMERGDFDKAIRLFRLSIERDKMAAPVHLNLGMALIQKGQTEEAKEEFRIAIQLQPNNGVAYLNLGSIFAATNSFKLAEKNLLAAIKHQPKDKRALLMLAGVYRRLNRTREALPFYRRVLAEDPANERALVGYSTSLMRLGEHSNALTWLREAHRVIPQNQVVIHLLSRLLSASPDPKLRDGKSSLELAEKATEKQAVMFAETKAMALAELGKFTEAVRWQKQAISQARLARQSRKATLLELVLKEYQQNRPWRLPSAK